MAAHLRSLGSGRPESPLMPGTGPAPGGLAGEGGCLCLATVLATAAAKLTSAIYLLSPLKGQNHFLGALAFTADITDGLLPGARLHFRLPPPLNQPVRFPCPSLRKNRTGDPKHPTNWLPGVGMWAEPDVGRCFWTRVSEIFPAEPTRFCCWKRSSLRPGGPAALP